MRIISGYLGGRCLHPPKNLPVRPTTDQAKEALFNILSNIYEFENLSVLDLFSGTGSISLEFVSRGCKHVTAVDANFRCVKFIHETSKALNIDNLTAYRADVFFFLKKCTEKYDIIFVDPPYDMENIISLPDIILEKKLISPEGLLIVEHSVKTNFSQHQSFWQQRRYGKVHFSFFKPL